MTYKPCIFNSLKSIPIVIITLLSVRCSHESTGIIDIEGNPSGPELFAAGVISTHLNERDIAISPSGDEIIFTLGPYRQSRRCLVRINKTGNNWGNKEIIDFSGRYDDLEPFISPDGKSLFFVSNRPLPGESEAGDYNIWISVKENNAWGKPHALDSTVNSPKDEFYPSVSSNGNLYFTSEREHGRGSEDIFLSRFKDGEYLDPDLLDSTVNTAADEFNAYVTPAEDLIIFGSYGRADEFGGGDLYFSRKDGGRWLNPINMGPEVNSERLDYCPFIDIPRGNFYFTSERAAEMKSGNVEDINDFASGILNGMGNIYVVSLDVIER